MFQFITNGDDFIISCRKNFNKGSEALAKEA